MSEFYSTSCSDMLKEKSIWEACIKGSTIILDLFNKIDPNNFYLSKYINVLFGMRVFKDSKNDFDMFLSDCERSGTLDNYRFHKYLRSFMADADSVLDYTDKFYKELKTKNDKIFTFNRKNHDVRDFSEEVSQIRNSLLHEGVPTLSTGYRTSGFQCHTNTAGSSKYDYVAYVSIKLKDTEGKTYEVKELTDRVFNTISRLLAELTEQLISIFTDNSRILE